MLTRILIVIFSCVAITAAASLKNDILKNQDLNLRDYFEKGHLIEIDLLEKDIDNFFDDNEIVPVPSIRPKDSGGLDPPIIDTNDTISHINPKQTSCTCGNRNLNGARIVGGTQTKSGEIPWRALVSVFDPNTSERGVCGGTIISPNWILTAAHCLTNIEPWMWINVYVGAQANPLSYISGTKIRASTYFLHPSYDDQTEDNDIALVRLSTPLTYKSNVSPACLPFGSLAKSDFKGTTVLASGWGTTYPVPASQTVNDDPVSPSLLKVFLPVLTTAECRAFRNMNPTENQFCTYKAGYDTCQGDSGGTIDYLASNGKYYAIGVVSFGFGCAQKDYPGVYAKVNNYLGWIQSITGEKFCQL